MLSSVRAPRRAFRLAALLFAVSCRGVEIDPAVAEAPLPRADDPVDVELAAAGETLYLRACLACHLEADAPVGPSLGDLTERRSPEWIRAMVLSPDSMLVHDSTARALLEIYAVPMPDLQLDEPRYRAIWEYMRSW